MRRRSGICLAVFLLFAAAAGCGKGNGAGAGATAKAQGDAATWVPFNDGMARSAREKKQVIIDFYTSWCRWCKVMDRETFRNPEVEKYLGANFVTIRVDAENTTDTLRYQGLVYTPASLARRFGVRGYPSLAYLEADGALIAVVPGFMRPDRFLPLLEYMHGDWYKRSVTFEEFLKKRSERGAAGTE